MKVACQGKGGPARSSHKLKLFPNRAVPLVRKDRVFCDFRARMTPHPAFTVDPAVGLERMLVLLVILRCS
jgi:hypothetical protein